MLKSFSVIWLILVAPVAMAESAHDGGVARATASLGTIDPRSPVLGTEWGRILRDPSKDPLEAIRAIQQSDPNWRRNIHIQEIAYIRAVRPGLLAYCKEGAVANSADWTTVEGGAIPNEMTRKLQDSYQSNLEAVRKEALGWTDDKLAGRAMSEAVLLGMQRQSCPKVQRFMKQLPWMAASVSLASELRHRTADFLDGLVKGPLLSSMPMRLVPEPHRVDGAKYLEANWEIMSPEVAYPRVQFSINGLTRHVYSELLQDTKLKPLLADSLWLANKWMARTGNGEKPGSFIGYMVENLRRSGYTPKQALLVLSYSMRNMPSLDIQYGEKPEESLLLEAYFWKFHDIRRQMQSKYYHQIFPGDPIERNPGIYHFTTAALHAYELKHEGFSTTLSTQAAFGAAVAYKADKLKGAIDYKRLFSEGPSYIGQLASDQGTKAGMQAGLFGGAYGASLP